MYLGRYERYQSTLGRRYERDERTQRRYERDERTQRRYERYFGRYERAQNANKTKMKMRFYF